MLVNFLMEVLDACHNAGLVVVAVCDMGFVIKKLQQCLILISLNAHLTFYLILLWYHGVYVTPVLFDSLFFETVMNNDIAF
jgi:hypothetical protein